MPMRNVTFQSVYDGVLRRDGKDPLADNGNQDRAQAIAQKIQKRVRKALRSWAFMEWSHTEERAFRTVWNASRQFYKINGDTGKPDEVFYIPTTSYYSVLSSAATDPPLGTLPTNTGYFAPLTPVDTYIELDTACRHRIGQMLGVYPLNPRLNGCGQRGLAFRPSEKGIDICATSGPTVFISYVLPEPKYTKTPYIPLATYIAGQRVFQPADGNVYRCLVTTTNHAPPDPIYWALEPMLETLADYAEAGAYADYLRGAFAEGEQEVRLARAQLAETEAENSLEQEIDALQAQGQTNRYDLFNRQCGWWCSSQPWPGGSVTTLTDTCEGDDAFIPPLPSGSVPQGALMYRPDIKSLDGSTAPGLSTFATVSLPLDTMIVIYSGEQARLTAGAADTGNPGQIAPADYNATGNNKHWEEVL